MRRQILSAVIMFVAVIVAYNVYALMATPLLEPTIVRRETRATGAEFDAARNAVARYQQVLAHYFPADHWSLVGTPKVVETDTGSLMFVLEDFSSDATGAVTLTRCAAVVFPTPRVEGRTPPRDAVVIEAAGGARLQFSEPLDLGRGKIGKPVWGAFPGELVIRSDMHEPGPQDDLRVVTRDLQLNESMQLVSQHAVRFRLGQSQGAGRNLAIQLLRDAGPASVDQARPAGIEWLELREEVRINLRGELAGGPLAPKNFAPGNAAPNPQPLDRRVDRSGRFGESRVRLAAAQQPVAPQPVAPQQAPRDQPIMLESKGPLRIDFLRFFASLEREVRVTQVNPIGQSDQLTCEQLRLHFGDGDGKAHAISAIDEPEVAKKQQQAIGRLEPYLVEASGDPVRFDSPARRLEAWGREFRYVAPTRRLTLAGGRAAIRYGASEIQAPRIEYRHPLDGEPRAIGDLAIAGPGSLRAVPREDDPGRVIEARWGAGKNDKPPVRIERDPDGRPALVLDSQPEIAASSVGRIKAQQLRVAMFEVPADGADGPAIELGGQDGLALLVERIDALGAVDLRSPQLSGQTSRLTAWFRRATGAETAALARKQSQGGVGGGLASARADETKAPPQVYELSSHEMRLDVGMFGRRVEPMSLLCSGDVRFLESRVARTGEQPLLVTGQQLRVDDLHMGDVTIAVEGAGPKAAESKRFATVEARGVQLWGAALKVDQAANRVWIDGEGNARVRLKQELFAGSKPQQGSGPTNLALRWQGGLAFDGQQIVIRDDVLAETAGDWLRCDTLTATLSEAVRFGQSGGAPVDVAAIDCAGGVTLDHRTQDAQGQQSHESARLSTLRIDRTTGDISGQGPGWVRSVHLASSTAKILATPGAAPQAPQPTRHGLSYLRVNFQRGVSGNLDQRVLRFHERVRAVYGPVLAWEQELPIDSPQGVPPGVAALGCEQLIVAEDPAGRYATAAAGRGRPASNQSIGPLELRALGDVRLEGTSDDGARFNAEAYTASYAQLKDVFVLEGNGAMNATIWVRQNPADPPATSVARKITYERGTGRVRVEDLRDMEYTPTNQPPRTAAPRGAPGLR
ncbi:hypothetical protein Mal64_00510 [Pseudobythopirellula maris]|uniref:OstA-like protein n=1 Tax=Pseudobythopirellula maris TaxID=2527991 RepID=A0A5C5ZQ78_9BACT|nr:hypothetical protein [Pseudobythopirellula maris]TWT89672.1 hypothetical protein Mal64_00510 [Pseudobythopirellula maris]